MTDDGPGSPARSAPTRSARDAVLAVRDEVGKVVVGQQGVVSGVIASLLTNGHVLLEGVPGVAKTLLAKAVAAAFDMQFTRIQFTPDLMPSDVIGQSVIGPGIAGDQPGAVPVFRFREGPVFTNLLLADEINRTPPKTQAALLEAMEERQVTFDSVTRPLPDPFLVIATQNPIEYEGTYPLPEAQLDRFLFKLHMQYPSADEEEAMVARHDAGLDPHDVHRAGVRAVANAVDLANARAEIRDIRVDPVVQQYIVALCRATRVSPSLQLGVSPRGTTWLLRAAKSWAWLNGRQFVTPDEVKAVAKPCLRHRVMVRPELEIEGTQADAVLDGLLATVPTPR
jgi:MoxR-like ATPase